MDYREALETTPAPGSGCHPHLLTIANIGTRTGRDRNQIFNDTRQAIPGGRRKIPDREIWDAINKAEKDNRQTGNTQDRLEIGSQTRPSNVLGSTPTRFGQKLWQPGRETKRTFGRPAQRDYWTGQR